MNSTFCLLFVLLLQVVEATTGNHKRNYPYRSRGYSCPDVYSHRVCADFEDGKYMRCAKDDAECHCTALHLNNEVANYCQKTCDTGYYDPSDTWFDNMALLYAQSCHAGSKAGGCPSASEDKSSSISKRDIMPDGLSSIMTDDSNQSPPKTIFSTLELQDFLSILMVKLRKDIDEASTCSSLSKRASIGWAQVSNLENDVCEPDQILLIEYRQLLGNAEALYALLEHRMTSESHGNFANQSKPETTLSAAETETETETEADDNPLYLIHITTFVPESPETAETTEPDSEIAASTAMKSSVSRSDVLSPAPYIKRRASNSTDKVKATNATNLTSQTISTSQYSIPNSSPRVVLYSPSTCLTLIQVMALVGLIFIL